MNAAIVAAAGRGTRFGRGRAKQFVELCGVPVIVHTLRRFERCESVGETIVVLPAEETAVFAALAEGYELKKLARVVAGGATRGESVWRGLQALSASGVVAVHDGVRPFVSPSEIDRVVRAAEETGAALLAVPATDTLKEVRAGRVARTLERSSVWHAQTPQCFRQDLLRRAYESALAEGLDATDDSALVERLGVSVSVVEGSARNVKITRPEDIAVAEILLREFEE